MIAYYIKGGSKEWNDKNIVYLCRQIMKQGLLILSIIMLIPLCGNAQWRYRFPRRNREPAQLNSRLQYYSDSLTSLKNRIYSSPSHVNKSEQSEDELRMFLPLTFYHDISRKAFTPNDSLSFADRQMLRMYMQHPDRVRSSESEILEAGAPAYEPEEPLRRRQPDFVEKSAGEFVEPETTPFTVVLKKPNFWNFKGDFSLQFMQNYISGNWYKGGESNYSALSNVTMEANFNNKQKVKWDNKLELRFGMQSSRSDSLHRFKTTEDLFRLTSKLGLQAVSKWYYTLQVIAYSQFTHSYKSNDQRLYSDFLAPLNLNVSIGMDYNVDWLRHALKGTIHLAPFAYNMKYTRKLELCDRLGMDPDHHFKNDFGSEFTVDLTWQLMEMLKWKTRLYGYTSYERAELEWENTFTLQFNKWISAQLFVYPRFDDGVTRDDHHGYWQFKEYISIGFQYSF